MKIRKEFSPLLVVILLIASSLFVPFGNAGAFGQGEYDDVEFENDGLLTIYGDVVDPNGEPVENALVLLTNLETGEEELGYIEEGTYEVAVEGAVGDTINATFSSHTCMDYHEFVIEEDRTELDLVLDPIVSDIPHEDIDLPDGDFDYDSGTDGLGDVDEIEEELDLDIPSDNLFGEEEEEGSNIILVKMEGRRYHRLAFTDKWNRVKITLRNDGESKKIIKAEVRDSREDGIINPDTLHFGMMKSGREKTRQLIWKPFGHERHYLILDVYSMDVGRGRCHDWVYETTLDGSFNVVPGDRPVTRINQDWVIDEPTVIEYETVVVYADMYVNAPFELVNATIVGDSLEVTDPVTIGAGSDIDIGCSEDGEYYVKVFPTGILNNYGKLWNNPSDKHYWFWMNGTLNVTKDPYADEPGSVSELYGHSDPSKPGGIMAYDAKYLNITNGGRVNNSASHGVYLNNTNANIDGGVVEDCDFYGVYVDRSQPIIKNSEFKNNNVGVYSKDSGGEVYAEGMPNYTPGEDLGYFIWHDNAGWHIRFSADYSQHVFEGTITANGDVTTFTRTVSGGEEKILDIGEYDSVTFDILLDGEYTPGLVYIGTNNTNPADMPFTLGASFEISENTLTSNNGRGIWLDKSAPEVSGNSIEFSNNGIRCDGSSPRIINNQISSSGYGINLLHSTPHISNNHINDNAVGVFCRHKSMSKIDSNDISYNAYGITCYSGSNTTIENNDIIGNHQVGIYVNNSSPFISNNIISSSQTYQASGKAGSRLMSESLSDGIQSQMKHDSMILLNTRSFSTTYEEPNSGPKEENTYLMHFKDIPLQNQIYECKNLGADFYGYIPNNAYMVRLDNNSRENIEDLEYINWIGYYKPEDRISNTFELADEITNATIRLINTSDVDSSISKIDDIVLETQDSYDNGDYRIMYVRFNKKDLQKLSVIDGVIWIEPRFNIELMDEVSTEIVGGGWQPHQPYPGYGSYVHQLGWTGDGVTVSVVDTGIDTGVDDPTIDGDIHPDLDNRVIANIGYIQGPADTYGHGTHCAGIIAGNGNVGMYDSNGYNYGIGVAPDSNLVNQDVWTGLGLYPLNPSRIVSDALSEGAYISSNSWGWSNQHGIYNSYTSACDQAVRDGDSDINSDQPFIIIYSAGNEGKHGMNTVCPPSTAKNVISVGASENYRNADNIEGRPTWRSDDINEIADYSSKGPTNDGRIKPDIVAPGTMMYSANSSQAPNNAGWDKSQYYIIKTGTSMACPQVAGGAAIFVQYYNENYGANPSPALTKAALLNGAVDMPEPDPDPTYDRGLATPNGPNNLEGWGRMNLTNVVGGLKDIWMEDQQHYLETGEKQVYNFEFNNPSEAIEITLVWTDYPSEPLTSKALVNDLDLILESPDGKTYHGNNQYNGFWMETNKKDEVNNVESIRFEPNMFLPGEYTITVNASEVVSDSLQDTPETDQDYALVVSQKKNTGKGGVYFDREAYRSDSLANIYLGDANLGTNPHVVEYTTIKATSLETGDEEKFDVYENSVDSSLFMGNIQLENNPSANIQDGFLQVIEGDTIYVTYNDLDDGTGSSYLSTDRAYIDDTFPVITNVSYALRPYGEVIFKWDTSEKTNTKIRYSDSLPLENEKYDWILTKEHSISIWPERVNVEYLFEVISTDEAGNSAIDDNLGDYYKFLSKVFKPGEGILIVNDSEPTVTSNEIIFNGDDGIYAENSEVEISCNNISSNAENGIQLVNSSNSLINLNNLTYNIKASVHASNSEDLDVFNNNISFQEENSGMIYIKSDNTEIHNNIFYKIQGNYEYGIKLITSENVKIYGNLITGSRGININKSNDTYVYSNTIDMDGYDAGVLVSNYIGKYTISNNIIEDNLIIDSSSIGVYIMGKRIKNTKIIGNTINNNTDGIRLYSSYAHIESNVVNNSEHGIRIYRQKILPYQSTIENNILTNNTYGIYSDYLSSDSPIVRGNVIKNNKKGIFISQNEPTNWNMYRNNKERNGFIDELPDFSDVLWEYEVGAEIYSSPAIVNERIYFGSSDGNIYCFGIDGTKLWEYNVGAEIYSSPAVVDNKVYFGTMDNYIYCLNSENGDFIWRFETNGYVISSPLAYNGKIFVGSNDGYMYALDSANGGLVWKTGSKVTHIHSSPSIINGNLFYGNTQGEVYCLTPSDGTIKWITTLAGGIYSSIVKSHPFGLNVAVGTTSGYLYILDTMDGSEKGRIYVGPVKYSSPAFDLSLRIYIASVDGNVTCINPWQDEIIWRKKFGKEIISSPAIFSEFGEGVGALGVDNNLITFSLLDGDILAMDPLNSKIYSSPAVTNKGGFVATVDGKFIAYRAKTIIEDNTITNNNVGIEGDNLFASVSSNDISNNTIIGVNITGCRLDMIDNTISNNYKGVVSVDSLAKIKDNTISNNYQGVEVNGNHPSEVTKTTEIKNNNFVENNYSIRVHRTNAPHPSVNNNSFEDDNWNSITIGMSSACVDYNTIDGSRMGIYVYKTGYQRGEMKIKNNFVDTNHQGIVVSRSEVTVFNNTIRTDKASGISVHRDSEGIIKFNDVVSNRRSTSEPGAISVVSSYVDIENNTCHDSDVGFYAKSYEVGETGEDPISLKIVNNTFVNNNLFGVNLVSNVDGTTLKSNNITNNEDGIYTNGLEGTVNIINNNISFNQRDGVSCRGGDGSVILKDNIIGGNGAWGIHGGTSGTAIDEAAYIEDISGNTYYPDNGEGRVLQEWMLTIYVTYQGQPRNNTEVDVYDKTGTLVLDKNTSGVNYVHTMVTEYFIDNTGTTYTRTPHTIFATYGTLSGTDHIYVNKNMKVTIELTP